MATMLRFVPGFIAVITALTSHTGFATCHHQAISVMPLTVAKHADMTDIPFTTLAQGSRSHIHGARNVIIRDQASLQALLTPLGVTQGSKLASTTVDFSSQMVVGIFLGMRRTGGYSVTIDRVVRDANDGTITVYATEKMPPPGAITIQALTYPFHLVLINATADEVKFVLAVP